MRDIMIEKIQQDIDTHLAAARDTIDSEVKYVDVKPYSHNIISLTLQHVNAQCGKQYANQLIDEFDLEDLGWHKVM